MSVQAASPSLNLVPWEWNSKFATRRILDPSSQNKPLIEARAEIGLEDNVGTHAGPDEEENVVRVFMRGPDDSDACLPQADKVEAFCFGSSLEILRAEEGNGKEPLVAWLDERSFATGRGRSRPYRGPLTARNLYRELKKPRFRVENLSDPKLDEIQQEEPDAERRLIFITDLDRWSIYALIGTASYYQAFALRDAIYKHLAFENFIGVTFSPDGLDMFQLAFHLPYYAWRSSQSARGDHRLDANASPLRQSRDVSFLNWNSSAPPGYLYEAQISCVVAGSDEWRWVAYCFADTYFNAEDEKESVKLYHEDSLAEEGMRADPFTFGATNADQPISTPREYFLRVLQIRINLVKQEWQQVITQVQQSIREYVETHHNSLSLSREPPSPQKAEDQDKMVRKSRDWVVRVRRLSRQLSQDLSKTVGACERFCSKPAVYFQNPSESIDGHRSLSNIQKTFDELESLKKTLESLTERCADFAQDLELHLSLEGNYVGIRHKQIAEDSKGLSEMMMLYITPITLTATIFSMNKDVISFIPASFGSFVGLTFVFSVLGIVIYILAGHRRSGGKMREPVLEILRFYRQIFLPRRTGGTQRDLEEHGFELQTRLTEEGVERSISTSSYIERPL